MIATKVVTWITVGAILAAAAFVYVRVAASFSPLKSSAEATKDFIVLHVPFGESIEAARQYMTKAGFQCNDMKNERFTGDSVVGHVPSSEERANFLWCDSGDRGFLVGKRWQVMFVDSVGTVAGIAVSVGLTGP